MIKILNKIFLLLLSYSCLGQEGIIEFQNIDKSSSIIRIYKNDENFFQASVTAFANEYTEWTVTQKAIIKIKVKQPQFQNIRIDGETGFVIALSPGDTVKIAYRRHNISTFPKHLITFEGTDKEAHQLYIDNYYPIGRTFNGIDKIEKECSNYLEYYTKTRTYIDSICNDFRTKTNSNYLSHNSANQYLLDIKASLYNYGIRRMGNVKLSDTTDKWFNYNEWRKYKTLMFFYGEVQNSNLLQCYTGRFLYNSFLEDIIKQDPTITDTLIKNTDLNYFYLYPKKIRNEAWGSYLYMLVKEFPGSSFKNEIALYKRYYPNSEFIRLITHFRDSIIDARNNINDSVNFVSNNQSTSIKEFFLPFNGRFFFIDCWATWCMPCIQEFNFYNDFAKFFGEIKVKQVFFSFNNIQDSTRVINYITQEKIKGIHTIANSNIKHEIGKKIAEQENTNNPSDVFSIPRYLLYDKVKDTIYVNLPRPSSGSVLKNEVSKIIERK